MHKSGKLQLSFDGDMFSQQIRPRSMNSVLGGDDDSIYLIVSDLGNDSGSGLDFISM